MAFRSDALRHALTLQADSSQPGMLGSSSHTNSRALGSALRTTTEYGSTPPVQSATMTVDKMNDRRVTATAGESTMTGAQ